MLTSLVTEGKDKYTVGICLEWWCKDNQENMMGLVGAGTNNSIMIQKASLVHADCVMRVRPQDMLKYIKLSWTSCCAAVRCFWAHKDVENAMSQCLCTFPILHFTLFIPFYLRLSHPHFLFITFIFTLTPPLTMVVLLQAVTTLTDSALTVKVFSHSIFSHLHLLFFYPPLTFSLTVQISWAGLRKLFFATEN